MTKEITIAVLILLAAIAAASVLIVRDYRSAITGVDVPRTVPQPTPAVLPIPPRMQVSQAPAQSSAPSAAIAPPAPAPAARRGRRQPPQVSVAPVQSISEPQAREALRRVGADDASTRTWSIAINDEHLSADARKNLIEDLNETGFDDPRNITPDDLPLIESRLALIEQMAPDAMDQTNAAAFAEAYKDLSSMRDRLNPQQ